MSSCYLHLFYVRNPVVCTRKPSAEMEKGRHTEVCAIPCRDSVKGVGRLRWSVNNTPYLSHGLTSGNIKEVGIFPEVRVYKTVSSRTTREE